MHSQRFKSLLSVVPNSNKFPHPSAAKQTQLRLCQLGPGTVFKMRFSSNMTTWLMTSYFIMSTTSYVMMSNVMTCYFMTSYVMKSYFMTSYVMTSYVMTSYLMTSHLMTSYFIYLHKAVFGSVGLSVCNAFLNQAISQLIKESKESKSLIVLIIFEIKVKDN